MSAAETRASAASDGIDLVDKDDGRCALLRLLKQIAHTARADTDIQLDKVRAGDAQERYTRLARNRTCDQRLASARRSDEQHALRNACADFGELARVFQKLDDFLKLRLFLVRTCHIVKRDLALVIARELRARLAELHCAASAAVLLVEHEVPEQGKDDHQHDIRHDAHPPRQLRALRIIRFDDAALVLILNGFAHLRPEQALVRKRIGDGGAVLELCGEYIVLGDEFCDLLVFKVVDHIGIRQLLRRIGLHQNGNCSDQNQHDQRIKSVSLPLSAASIAASVVVIVIWIQ